jgi:hypothetical protein
MKEASSTRWAAWRVLDEEPAGKDKRMTPLQRKRACSIQAVASVENLLLAAVEARRGKSTRPDVETWWMIQERETATLREELQSGAYAPAGYRFFEIREPKRRLIAAAPFRDRAVHHALCNVIAPVLMRRFIARSFSCQIGKGTTAARECCRKLVNRHQYVLKCDVSKFFPNIDHRILFGLLLFHDAPRNTRPVLLRRRFSRASVAHRLYDRRRPSQLIPCKDRDTQALHFSTPSQSITARLESSSESSQAGDQQSLSCSIQRRVQIVLEVKGRMHQQTRRCMYRILRRYRKGVFRRPHSSRCRQIV